MERCKIYVFSKALAFATRVTNVMALENLLSRMGLDSKQFNERYAEYTAPMQEQQLFYAYEPSAPSHGHTAPTKHHYTSGSHKGNAAMSALTLLAFLFFLHILQQCLKDHTTAMSTPQVMIMSAGKEGAANVAKLSGNNKFDKTGLSQSDENGAHSTMFDTDRGKREGGETESRLNADVSSSEKLLRIKTAEHKRYDDARRRTIIKNRGNQTSMFADLYDVFNNDGER